jgi:hypothetical protein
MDPDPGGQKRGSGTLVTVLQHRQRTGIQYPVRGLGIHQQGPTHNKFFFEGCHRHGNG